MKPYSRERFDQAVDKALIKLKEDPTPPNYTELPTQMRAPDSTMEKIVVKNGSKIQIIPIGHISHIEAEDDYVRIHCNEGKFLKQARMKNLEENLPSDRFLRIHRSFILRIDLLNKIEAYTKDSYLATLEGGLQLPVSRSGYQKLKEVLDI